MKRIICLMIALLILFSVIGCDVPKVPSGELDDTTESIESTDSSTGKIDAEPYDGIFKTGYSRVVITPELPIENFTNVGDDIYATCVAVNDGDNTVILISIDIGSINADVCDRIKARVNQTTKIPTKNIVISATHTHSTVHFETSSKWATTSFAAIANASKKAIDDLADSEIYVGVGKTTGMGFVRRYVNSDGTMSSVNPINSSIRSVSEADDTVQVIRFVREEKKDIVMANWQGHFADAVSLKPNSISSDIGHYLREGVESGDDDALMVYFAGAGGNINLNPPNRSFRKYKNYMEVGQALAKVILEAADLESMTRCEAGEIKITDKTYKAETKKDSTQFVAEAKERIAKGTASNVENYIVSRNSTETKDLYLSVVSFGDLAFVAAPYEMFDNNGVQIKSGSPFNMTFILTNAGGALAYMPSYEACTEYGGYETEATYFGAGTAEKLVDEYLSMLRTHRKK